MSRFYTRSGDDGYTGWLGKGRLPKYHPRIEALGAVDEADAALGLARALAQLSQTEEIILAVQRDLHFLMAEIAVTPDKVEKIPGLRPERLEWLEGQLDALASRVSLPDDFIVPGDSLAGAALALARTIVRRAERQVAALSHAGELENPLLLQYLNRLSSLCFTLEVLENQGASTKAASASF